MDWLEFDYRVILSIQFKNTRKHQTHGQKRFPKRSHEMLVVDIFELKLVEYEYTKRKIN